MGFLNREIDITKNIKMIEWLKSELLTDIANLFRQLISGFKEETEEILAETLSNIIIITYLLSKRLGINYNIIDLKIDNKLKIGIAEQNDLEKNYGDLSELSRHINNTRSINYK